MRRSEVPGLLMARRRGLRRLLLMLVLLLMLLLQLHHGGRRMVIRHFVYWFAKRETSRPEGTLYNYFSRRYSW